MSLSTPVDPPERDFKKRREILAAQIAGQRGELAQAYRNLEKPIRYTEYGLRAFAWVRGNPWVFVAAPAAVNIATTLFGWGKKKSSKLETVQQQTLAKRAGGIKSTAVTAGKYAWQLFQLYRRVRPYFP